MFGLEIRKPARGTFIGFLVAWGVVALIMLFTLFLAHIGE